jgi:TonB family protein
LPCDIMSASPANTAPPDPDSLRVHAPADAGGSPDLPQEQRLTALADLIGPINLADIPPPIQSNASAADDGGPAPDPELANLAWGNPLTPEEADELASLAQTRRVIILRLQQWVIPVSGLLSFLLAVLIEAGLVATVWWVLHWHPLGGGGNESLRSGSGSTAVGGIIQGTGANAAVSNATARWRPGPLPAPPNLPNQPLWKPHTNALAVLDNASVLHAALPVIGINSNLHAWAAPAHTLAPKTPHFKISPQDQPGQHTRGRGPQPDSRGAQPDATGGAASGGAGTIQLFKPGARTALGSATGGGPGRGRGAGVGGGGSIVTPPPNPVMPLKYQFAWPAHLINPKFQLTIRPDGTVANVKVLISSGHAGIDQAIIDALEQARFLPNIVSGKPVESKFIIRYQLTS